MLTQTAYARLLDRLLVEGVGDLSAGTSLVSKSIRGRRYWYAQRYEAGKKIQAYLGPDSEGMDALVNRWRQSRADAEGRAELVAMARAGGCHTVTAAEARVLELLANVFRLGGVLVGSHAFAVLGNVVGVRWQEAIARTEDVDIAHDRRMAVALAAEVGPMSLPRALGNAVPRFSVLNPTYPATSYRVRGTDVEVELLTPLVGRERRRPIHIPALDAAATPMRFLDYLIEETQPAAVVGGHGVLVNVPRPGRFALHKLIVAGRRAARPGGATKAGKDLAQASALLRVLLGDLPGEISIAWKALSARGKGWVDAARRSLPRLDEDLVKDLGAMGIGRAR